jgi:hypothetical protein
MDTPTIVGVLGTIGTVSFGTWSVYFALRKHRYPASITFVKESSIGLFESIVRNLPELDVLYNHKPVSENLVLLKGAFLNTGTKDITEDMVETKLTIKLPDGYRWLTAKPVLSSPNITPTLKIQDSCFKDLEFTFRLFRCDESRTRAKNCKGPLHLHIELPTPKIC